MSRIQLRGLLGHIRQYARDAKRNLRLSLLSHLSQRIGRPLQPALVRVHAQHKHRQFPRPGIRYRSYHTLGPFRIFCPAGMMVHGFSAMRCFSTMRSVRPFLFSPNYLFPHTAPAKVTTLRAFTNAATNFFCRDRRKFPKFTGWNTKFTDSFQEEARKLVAQNYGKRFIHSKGDIIKPIDVIRNTFQGRGNKPIRTRPLNPPSFIFPRPSLDLSMNEYSATLSSSLPSFSVLTRAFHTTPETGSYVDFDMTPNMTIPPVTQLTPDIVDRVTDDIERHIAELRAVADNIRRLASLGELPVSIEDRGIRVYFPNCEPEQVDSLLVSAEVTQGVIRSHNDNNIISPIDSSSESAYYLNSESSDSASSSDGFYYNDMESVSRRNSVSSSDSYDIARIRGFSQGSINTPPPLTSSASYDTFSEGYTYLV